MKSDDTKKEIPPFTKLQVVKNLMVISGSCLLTFTSHDGLLVLQSTLNREKGIGVISLAVQYAFSCLSSLLLPKYLIKRFGCKAVIVVSMVTFFPFIASNFYPRWILMLPASVLLGVGYALLWSAHCAYLNGISGMYAHYIHCTTIIRHSDNSYVDYHEKEQDSSISDLKLDNRTEDDESRVATRDDILDESGWVKSVEYTTARFFGFHAMMYQLCYVTSNLISFYVLRSDDSDQAYNGTSACSCGADYCNVDTECSDHNLTQPPDRTKYILLSIFVALSVLSVLLVLACLDRFEKRASVKVKLSMDLLLATCRRTKERNQLLMIPLTLYIGMGQGFYVGDFTKSYVGCAWGIQNIGIVTVCSGMTMALSSPSSGWLVKHVGRVPIFLVAWAMNIAVILILLLWSPNRNEPHMFFIASGLWGSLFGILWSQFRAFYGVLFKEDEEAAFGSYQLWHSVGSCLSLSYSNYICTSVKIYIMLGVSTLGFIGYLTVERFHFKTLNSK